MTATGMQPGTAVVASGASRPVAMVSMRPDVYREHFDSNLLAQVAQPAEPLFVEDLSAANGLDQVDVLFTGWGTGPFTPDLLDRMPRLNAVFHCAGSVRSLDPALLLERGIRLFSAAEQNARPVAEYTLAAIVMAGKRAPFLAVAMRSSSPLAWADVVELPLGNAGRTVGVIGFSRIGRLVVEGLTLPDADILVYDPYADAAEVEVAGARLVGLSELLQRSDVVSVHAPETAETYRMLGAEQLAAMKSGATLINTARGSLVDHDALATECASGRLSAILDVTDPEPLPDGSLLLQLPNVMVTPHVAGSLGTEIDLLCRFAIASFEAYLAGRATEDEVTSTQLLVLA